MSVSVSGGGAHKVKVTGERANDHRTLQMGPWVEGRLLLFDRSYSRYQLFDCIDRKRRLLHHPSGNQCRLTHQGHPPPVARARHRT